MIIIGKYALFAGGYGFGAPGGYQDTVDAYDDSLVRTIPTELSRPRYSISAANINLYAIFVGGWVDSEDSRYGDFYDTNLTRTYNQYAIYPARYLMGNARVSRYAIFAGGRLEETRVEAFDSRLTRNVITSLSQGRHYMGSARVGDYAIFAGGLGSGLVRFDDVTAYDNNLVRTNPTSLSSVRQGLAGATVGNYALFAGGYSNFSPNWKDEVEAYNTSLVKSTPTALSQARQRLVGATIGDYALFGGGAYSSGPVNIVDAYDSSLVRTTPTVLSLQRDDLAATTIGDYALFAGGDYDSNDLSDVVDAYDTSLVRTTPTVLSVARDKLNATSVGEGEMPPAFLTLDNVTISGTAEEPITPQDLVINIYNDQIISIGIADGTDLSLWITNLPSGLVAEVNGAVSGGATEVTLEISGTPTAQSYEDIAVTIPASYLETSTEDVDSDLNTSADFDINPAPISYEVWNLTDLDNVRNDLTGYYTQMADIDLGGTNFEPIGHYSYFTGKYDGNGFKIHNGEINYPDDDYVALFSMLDEGAELKNITLEDVTITGGWWAIGSIAGDVETATIKNCHNTGNVSGGDGTGGLVGYVSALTIENCSNTGDVAAIVDDWNWAIGGLIGGTADAGFSMSKCFNKGNVSGKDTAGGLIGDVWRVGSISDSYNTGAVSNTVGTSGGLVGLNEANITNCYSAGLVSGEAPLGGLIADNNGGVITDCYYDTTTSGQSDTGNGTPRPTEDMQDILTFSPEWDIATQSEYVDETWWIADGEDYPRLWYEYIDIQSLPDDTKVEYLNLTSLKFYSANPWIVFRAPTPKTEAGEIGEWILHFKVEAYKDSEMTELVSSYDSTVSGDLSRFMQARNTIPEWKEFPSGGITPEEYGCLLKVQTNIAPQEIAYIRISVGAEPIIP